MRVSIPLTGDLAIIQGETYQALTLTFPGDLTTWTPRGQIRTGLLEDAGTLLAEFAFGTPAYDADADTTAIYPTLTATQTANLPKTKYQGTGEYSRSGVYYYDIELESNDVVIKSKTAIVQVIGEVTGSGIPAPSTLETFLIASNNLSEITDPEAARNNLEIVGGVKPDWNATPGSNEEILNKPDLSVYATNTALIDGLATKQAVGNYLDTDDIGVSVQPFSVNTVIDPNYVATEESFTTAEKTALGTALQPDDIAGLAPLTSPNLTGTPTAPTAPEGTDTTQIATTAFVLANAGGEIENGIVINGVANFWQSTPPTTRGDGSALVEGDRWWKIDDGTEWFWNETNWVSTTKSISISTFKFSTDQDVVFCNTIPTKAFLVEEVKINAIVATTNTPSNYWSVLVRLGTFSNNGTSIGVFDTSDDSANATLVKTNLEGGLFAGSNNLINLQLTKTGNPGEISLAPVIFYRDVFGDIQQFLGANLIPDFWIDATNGNDANDGSESSPWASLNKINTIPLATGQTVTVRIKTGIYNKSSDSVTKNSVNNAGLNSILNLVFEPGCVMDGNRNGSNGFEFSGTNTYTTNIYGNGLQVNNYGESTSLSPNGVGNRDTHILYCYNVHCDNCDDGFSAHGNAKMYLYDCSAQNAEKGAVIHVDNAYVEHHRCTFIFKGLNNVVGSGTPTCLFYDCKLIPFANTGIGFSGGTFYNCQIGTLTARFQAGFTAFDSFVNVYVDANSRLLLTRCYGKMSVRVRGTSPSPPVTVENCVITGPATGQTHVVFSNFNFGQPAKIIFNNNIVESGAFMSIDSTNAGQLVDGGSQFFNNILSGSSAFDADLIAADTETNVVVGNVTADALIGAGNTLNPDDYGYIAGSPAIGAATNGGNCGFAVGEVFLPAEQQIPY